MLNVISSFYFLWNYTEVCSQNQFLVTLEVFSSFEPTTTDIWIPSQIFSKGCDNKFQMLLFTTIVIRKKWKCNYEILRF